MKKIKASKQVGIHMLRNPNEFGVLLVTEDKARVGMEIEVVPKLFGVIDIVYNFKIEVEIDEK